MSISKRKITREIYEILRKRINREWKRDKKGKKLDKEKRHRNYLCKKEDKKDGEDDKCFL